MIVTTAAAASQAAFVVSSVACFEAISGAERGGRWRSAAWVRKIESASLKMASGSRQHSQNQQPSPRARHNDCLLLL